MIVSLRSALALCVLAAVWLPFAVTAQTNAIELHSLDNELGAARDNDGADAVIGIQDGSGNTLDPLEWACDTASALEVIAASFTTCVNVDGDVVCGG